jgi:uncharacterized protein (DUF4415 family)
LTYFQYIPKIALRAMKKRTEFPFDRARRAPAEEVSAARSAIVAKLGKPRASRGRPPKGADKYTPVSIRLHPKVVAWAKREAKRRRIRYQTVINEVLLKAAG